MVLVGLIKISQYTNLCQKVSRKRRFFVETLISVCDKCNKESGRLEIFGAAALMNLPLFNFSRLRAVVRLADEFWRNMVLFLNRKRKMDRVLGTD